MKKKGGVKETMKFQKICITNFTYRRYSFDYFLNSARRLGINQIELSGCHPHFTQYEAESFDVKGLAKKIREAGMKVEAINPEQNFLPVNIAASQEYFRNRSIRQLEFYIQNAQEFGCNKVIVYPGKGAMDQEYTKTQKYAGDSIARLSETAEKYGVTLLIQNVSRCVSNLTPNAAALKEILDMSGNNRLGVSINTCAVTAGKETLEDYFDLFGDKIQMVQLSDSDEEDEQMVIGEGTQDFRSSARTLEKYSYSGPVALEIIGEEYAYGAEKYYRRSLEALKSFAGLEL